MAGEITTIQLETDILSATDAGRARIETDFFIEATVDDVFAASAIDDDRLKGLGTTHLLGGRDMGRVCVGYFYLTGVVVDAQTITINGVEYEFDDGGGGGIDNPILVPGGLDAVTACTAVVAALTTDGDGPVDGVVMDGNAANAGVMLIARAAQATQYTLATTCGNGVVSAGNLTGAAIMANRDVWTYQYEVTGVDVTQFATTGGNSIAVAGVNSTTEPVITGLTLRDTNGVVKSLATVIVLAVQAAGNFWVITVDDPATVLASADVLGFCLTV